MRQEVQSRADWGFAEQRVALYSKEGEYEGVGLRGTWGLVRGMECRV